MIPIKELHYSLQMLSQLSYFKSGYECILIIIYGFDRCSEDQFSSVLHNFGIESSDFWPNIINLILISIFFQNHNNCVIIFANE